MENTPKHPGIYPGYFNVRMIPADNTAESGSGSIGHLTDDEVILDKFMQKCLCARVPTYSHEYRAEEREWVDRMFFVIGVPEDRFVQLLKEERDRERSRAVELESKVYRLEKDLKTTKESLEEMSELSETAKRLAQSRSIEVSDFRKKMEQALNDMQKIREHFGNAAVDNLLLEEELENETV